MYLFLHFLARLPHPMRQIGSMAGYDEYDTKMAFGGHKTGAAISNRSNPAPPKKFRSFFVGAQHAVPGKRAWRDVAHRPRLPAGQGSSASETLAKLIFGGAT
jgi:hypothetical protein